MGEALDKYKEKILEIQEENFHLRKSQSRHDEIEARKWSYLIPLHMPLNKILKAIDRTLDDFNTVIISLHFIESFSR